MNRRLPVTLVGGFLGAGKTSFLHHAISVHQGGNLAVFVESPGKLNLDAKAIRGLCGAMRRFYDVVREIPVTDEAAQIEWLAQQLKECAQAERFERVLIEVGGTANAARLGDHFASSGKLAPWAELQQIICVVDALDFYRTRMVPAGERAPDPFSDFQRAQIEDAGLLVLNKCDQVEDAAREASTRLLRQLNPRALVIETDYGEIPAEVWSQPVPISEHRPDHTQPDSAEPAALASLLYRAHRPFHPQRFWDWFNADHFGLLRVKGLVWLATRNLLVGGVSRTRWQNSCGPAGIWWAALPREEWPEESEALIAMQEIWREPYGDRRQELILVGESAQLSSMVRQLDAALLNAEEYARPVQEWTALPDPFPVWDLDGD